MIDLSTEYLGMKLRSPIAASSGPLQKSLDNIRRMEDAGVAAVVMHSLFEEQLEVESEHLDAFLSGGAESFAESLSYFPDLTSYNIGPDGYLEHLRRAKETVKIPVIASLNGVSDGGWLDYARLIEETGVDALELNIYYLSTDIHVSGAEIERRHTELVRRMRQHVKIPLAVKLSSFFSSIPHMALELDQAGADSLVIFNRFYQPDFDLEELEVKPHLELSSPNELLLRLHWAAILYGRIQADIAITGGIHSAHDVLKAMMAGARAAMMTSCLLRHGISWAAVLERDLVAWMEEHEYSSIEQMQGSMSYGAAPDTTSFDRGNYMRVLSSYALRR
ncbi:MAG: dihydroorotate dehydrogenase-like protein [Acidimicrobiia bacterium]|nr:dihydroorotate dehydrogenase-like protein [Acidimicrobiia bacterium]